VRTAGCSLKGSILKPKFEVAEVLLLKYSSTTVFTGKSFRIEILGVEISGYLRGVIAPGYSRNFVLNELYVP